eukprot:6190170-Pleurochrysis_carterae.AAC.2
MMRGSVWFVSSVVCDLAPGSSTRMLLERLARRSARDSFRCSQFVSQESSAYSVGSLKLHGLMHSQFLISHAIYRLSPWCSPQLERSLASLASQSERDRAEIESAKDQCEAESRARDACEQRNVKLQAIEAFSPVLPIDFLKSSVAFREVSTAGISGVLHIPTSACEMLKSAIFYSLPGYGIIAFLLE